MLRDSWNCFKKLRLLVAVKHKVTDFRETTVNRHHQVRGRENQRMRTSPRWLKAPASPDLQGDWRSSEVSLYDNLSNPSLQRLKWNVDLMQQATERWSTILRNRRNSISDILPNNLVQGSCLSSQARILDSQVRSHVLCGGITHPPKIHVWGMMSIQPPEWSAASWT